MWCDNENTTRAPEIARMACAGARIGSNRFARWCNTHIYIYIVMYAVRHAWKLPEAYICLHVAKIHLCTAHWLLFIDMAINAVCLRWFCTNFIFRVYRNNNERLCIYVFVFAWNTIVTIGIVIGIWYFRNASIMLLHVLGKLYKIVIEISAIEWNYNPAKFWPNSSTNLHNLKQTEQIDIAQAYFVEINLNWIRVLLLSIFAHSRLWMIS